MIKVIDWSKYPNFSKEEFDCKETGENKMRYEFLEILQQIRKTYGRPMIITSGYRSPLHSIEAAKDMPGEHTYGVACDVQVNCSDVADLFVIAYGYGIRRFGLKQHGGSMTRFMHLGMGDKYFGFPESTWTYP